MLACSGIVEASGDALTLWRRLGLDDISVKVVLAVAGRSPYTVDMAALEEEGRLPVSSILRMRDFKSSSSSQTVEGAVVDTVDSVPSPTPASTRDDPGLSFRGEELYSEKEELIEPLRSEVIGGSPISCCGLE